MKKMKKDLCKIPKYLKTRTLLNNSCIKEKSKNEIREFLNGMKLKMPKFLECH